MAIAFINIEPIPQTVVRTANDVAPLDGGIEPDLSRNIPINRDNYRDTDLNYRDTPKRGRPFTGVAMSAAERQRLCRARKKQSGG